MKLPCQGPGAMNGIQIRSTKAEARQAGAGREEAAWGKKTDNTEKLRWG